MKPRQTRRWACMIAGVVVSGAAALQPAVAQELVMAVNEGSLKDTQMLSALAKYRPLANAIESVIKQPVIVRHVKTIKALEEGMKEDRYAFVLVRPADVAARGLRDHGYRYVVSSKPDGHCSVGVKKDSALRTLADIRGKRIAAGPEGAYLFKLCSADLRTHGIDLRQQTVQHQTEQGAVPLSVTMGMADVALLEVRTEKEWRKAGHRIVHTSVGQPFFPLLASGQLPAAQVDALQKKLAGLKHDKSGHVPLDALDIEGFDDTSEARLRALPEWLGH